MGPELHQVRVWQGCAEETLIFPATVQERVSPAHIWIYVAWQKAQWCRHSEAEVGVATVDIWKDSREPGKSWGGQQRGRVRRSRAWGRRTYSVLCSSAVWQYSLTLSGFPINLTSHRPRGPGIQQCFAEGSWEPLRRLGLLSSLRQNLLHSTPELTSGWWQDSVHIECLVLPCLLLSLGVGSVYLSVSLLNTGVVPQCENLRDNTESDSEHVAVPWIFYQQNLVGLGSQCHLLWNRNQTRSTYHTPGRKLHKDVFTGCGDPREPLRGGESEDPGRVSALLRITDW